MNSQVHLDKLSVKAFVVDDGIRIETDVMGHLTVQFMNLRLATQEKAIRDWLVANGWTPPKEKDSDHG